MKALRTAALIVGAVALVATGAGAIGLGIAGIASATTLSTIGAIASVTAGALSFAAAAAAPRGTIGGNATKYKIDKEAGIPVCLGRTYVGGNVVHRQYYDRPGDKMKNQLESWVAVLSLGLVASVGPLLIDKTTPVAFDGGGQAIGSYRGNMWLDTQRGACPEARALAGPFGAFPGWTGASKLSGLAADLWTLDFDSKGEKFPNGVPERGRVLEGVLVYDPRKDSTYPGGNGPCRLGQESTYVYSECPGPHAITWAYGRYQNGVQVAGGGLSATGIDLQPFVEWSNVCDANGWKVGGLVYTTADDPWDVLKMICQAGAAEPVPVAAQLSVTFSAPRVSIGTISSADIAGDVDVPAHVSRRKRRNTIIPQVRLESHGWEVVPLDAVTVPAYVAIDGGSRPKEITYPLIQQATQGAQVAMYDMLDERELDGIVVPAKVYTLGYRPGDCLTLQIPEANLIGRDVIVRQREIDAGTMGVTFTCRTETASKHGFALGKTGTPPPTPDLTSPGIDRSAPDAGDWSAQGTILTAAGVAVPAIVITGTATALAADEIVFDYRPYIAGSDPDVNWTGSSLEPATVTRKEITSVTAATQYDVGVRYRIRGALSARLILGPVTTGSFEGVKGDPGAGAITLVADSATTIVGANFARGTAGAGWGTDAAHSQEAYTGGAVASFTFPAIDGDNYFAAGLSQGNPGSAAGNSFTTISFAILRNPETGSTLAYINGEGVGSPGPVVPGAGAGRVHFDGRYVRWYVNNALIHTFDWMVGTYDPYDPINALRFRAAFAGDGAVDNITLVPAGTIGNDGLPGEAGEDGRTPYTHYAYANSADGAVDFVVGAPEGRTYEGRYSDYTPADSGSPAAYTWRQYLGPPFGLATRGAAVVGGTQVVKNGGAFAWDADAFSTVGFRGAAVASASPGQVNLDLMFGLNTDPLTDSSFASLDYAFFFQANGQLTIFESGASAASLGTYSTSATYQVAYDGRTIRYLVNGAVAREVAVAGDKLFYFDSSFYSPGARLQNVSFAAAGPAGVTPMTFELTKTAVLFTATYNGVLKDGQVPYTIGFSAKRGTTSLNAGTTLSISTSSGVSASRLDNDNIQITACTNDGTITINGTFPDGSALPTKQIAVSRQLDPAPPQSATGASLSIQCVNNTTSYVESGASDIMNLATDTSGKITLNAYTVYNSVGTPSNLTMAFRYEYRLAGASSWIAASETQGTLAQRYAASTGEPPDAGQWSQTLVLTGLAASSPYQFRVNGRRVSGSSSSANAGGVMKATVG